MLISYCFVLTNKKVKALKGYYLDCYKLVLILYSYLSYYILLKLNKSLIIFEIEPIKVR